MSNNVKIHDFKHYFVTGALARLNSGGPAMTVTEVHDDGIVETTWFVDGVLHRNGFNYQELMDVLVVKLQAD